jgi:hypothetical protein
MQGSVKDFDLNIRDLKVFKGEGSNMKEMISEEKTYNDKINQFKDSIEKLPFSQLATKFPFI